jgi:hypothetical protein
MREQSALQQNAIGVRLVPKPSHRQVEVHQSAEARYRARRSADLRSGHALVDLITRLSLMDSARRTQLRDANPFA